VPPRKSSGTGATMEETDSDTLVGDGSGQALPPADEESSAVSEPGPGELEGAIANLGAAVAANQQAENGTADAEGQHSAALDVMTNIADQLELDTGEMVFDVRDFLLDSIKSRPKPWSATSQGEQRDVAAACEHAARELIRKVVEALAARGSDAIRVLLTKVNAGGDDIVITGKVKFLDAEPSERDKSILSLHHAIGKHVMLTRASVDDYTGQGRDPQTDEDEPPLDFEAGGGSEEEDEAE
jgi:hypothetical protein